MLPLPTHPLVWGTKLWSPKLQLPAFLLWVFSSRTAPAFAGKTNLVDHKTPANDGRKYPVEHGLRDPGATGRNGRPRSSDCASAWERHGSHEITRLVVTTVVTFTPPQSLSPSP
ncbi:hypothetical protein BD779DRAFT_419334 [Infundibulicybe gibba]|nr:hypothetical protein BD779DRAFT_419334 [Infundibulicybe gibba]